MTQVSDESKAVPTPDPYATPPPQSARQAATPTPPRSSAIERTIVIEEGGGERAPTLVEAAVAERTRRQTTEPSTIVITDKNLKEKATGKLTIAAPDNQLVTAKSGQEATEAPKSESYWRSQALEARMAWRQSADEIGRWRDEVENLKRRFYDEDDPYYRDSQIKPAWDRAVERLRETRLMAEEARDQLAVVLEEGRRSGALPGWMREGIDLEPPAEPRQEDLEEHEIGEPSIYDPDGDGSSL